MTTSISPQRQHLERVVFLLTLHLEGKDPRIWNNFVINFETSDATHGSPYKGEVVVVGEKSDANGKVAYNITGKAPKPLGAYSHAVRAGDFLFVAGQGARHPDTGVEEGATVDASGNVTSYDIEVQTEAVIKNLRVTLQEAGLDLEDLVDVTVFLHDMKDFARYNKVYDKHFSFANPPARTTVQVAKLPGKNHIEIKATAFYTK